MKRILYLRKYVFGLTQKQLAQAVNCNPVSISRIEHGREPLFPERGKKIAKVLNWEHEPERLLEDLEYVELERESEELCVQA